MNASTTLKAVFLLLIALALAACGGQDQGATDTLIPEGPNWQATSYHDGGSMVELLPGTEITLLLQNSDGTVSGSAGCNQYNGSYQIDGNGITFGPLAATRQFCADPEGAMDQESAYLAALAATTGYRIVDNRMEFNDANNNVLVIFEG